MSLRIPPPRPSAYSVRKTDTWALFLSDLNGHSDQWALQAWWIHPVTQARLKRMPEGWDELAEEAYSAKWDKLRQG